MELRRHSIAEALMREGRHDFAQFRKSFFRLESRQGQMRPKRAFLSRNPDWFQRRRNGCCECSETRSCFDSKPEHARAALIREKSKIPEGYWDWGARLHTCERILDFGQLRFFHMADEFQRDVYALRLH